MSRRKPMHAKHRAIIAYMRQRREDGAWPATIREIGKEVGISSTAVVYHYLRRMEAEGLVAAPRSGIARAWSLTDKANRTTDLIRIPIIGKLRANSPIPTPRAR